MKGCENMNINTVYAHTSNYTKGRKQLIKYIVVHYTANDGDTARNNGNYFSQPNRNASAHYFVDENEIIQSVKDTDTAWHCGAKSYKHELCRNDNSIGIEMCSEKDEQGKYYINESTQNNTIELIKQLMQKYDISIENVLRHYDITGKLCPEPFVRNQVQWLDFKQKLIEKEGAQTIMIYNYVDDNMPDWAKPTIIKMIQKGYLHGVNERGELNLTYDMLRIFVTNDKAGVYDDK